MNAINDTQMQKKQRTHKYQLVPYKRIIEKEELDTYQTNLLGEDKLGIVPKLFLDLNNKEKYVIHHRLVEYYEPLGMKVTKVHRTISFKQSLWLKQYIDFNTN